ncbi:betaine aldehyde dehydrogenase-like [Tribolium madens]|uniref:betaine aldehyde dehydrogenase-like n=1 Tax=Tribolium madens TaxID=41895 RepID=UPI001CF7639A|nr:betaine aldehyde dehydrogenase-like [Tribolium madens]
MGDVGDSKHCLIRQIFETMSYGDDSENITEVTEWLKSKENRIFLHIGKKDEAPNGETLSIKNVNNDEALCNIFVPEAATVEAVLKKLGEAKNAWFEIVPFKRAEIIHKFGSEICKKQNLFAQLEVAIRGILSKDTKKVLPLLTDCLQYYSSFSLKYNSGNSSWKPEGLVVAILSDVNSLATFGYILGPCLAAGYNIILQTGPQLSLVASFLIEIAIQVGIPEDTIRLIPGDVDPNIFLIHPKVSVVSIFDDLYKEKYLVANHFNKKLINFYSSGIPMIIFDNCDLDSACHAVVNGVWGFTGMLPWSVRSIFVQENVFETFIQKLKHKIKEIRVGQSDKKNLDISSSLDNDALEKLVKIIEKAKNDGVEVFQSNNNAIPTLFIGGNVFHNNVIVEDAIKVPIVTLTAFRTINEAAALSNNTRQGLAASVWTESTSLANEIIGKLKVGTVWINSHGLFAADIPFSPFKSSGNAFFGGNEGFYEYVDVKSLKTETTSQVQNAESMEKAINEAKKAQDGWFKLDEFERMKNIQAIAQDIQKNKTWGLPENWINNWVTIIHDYISNQSSNIVKKKKSFNVVAIREPCGVIAIENSEDKEMHNKKLIIAALIEGNSVIILNDAKDTNDFYTFVTKLLPKGVLTLVSHSQEATKIAALHKELNVYIGEKNNKVFCSLPLKTSSKFKVVKTDEWYLIRNKVTLVKSVWFNKGLSFV